MTKQERQLKEWEQSIQEMEQDVAQSYHRKAQRDAFFIDYKNIKEEVI